MLTQEELAERAGVDARTIRDIETGRTAQPRASTVRALMDALTEAEQQRLGTPVTDLPGPQSAPRPRELPPDPVGFVGRSQQLTELEQLLDAAARQPNAVVISAVSGTAGVGKTALAVHWAHRVADRFPDGQLYLNLRGYDPDQPVAPADALARFLAALGVPGSDIPLDVDERSARYRTAIAGRRMLILLDNASSVEQVRLLLPGTDSCLVMVTSRDSLAGLVAVHGAYRLNLELLPAADARVLLRELIGNRVDAEPDAAATLAAQCAYLPLALRLAAELAASRPSTPLTDLAGELADQQRRLDLLDAGGDPRSAVTAVFSWSVRNLPPDVARTFRLLGLHPGPSMEPYAVAALTGTDLEHARRSLGLLVRAHLVNTTGPVRYGMHDLLRAYATNLATANDTDAALDRLFDYYLATSAAAMDRLYPAETYLRPRIPPAATPMPELSDPNLARAWLDAERPCLVAVATHTAAHGRPGHTVRLSATLYRYLDGGLYTDALTIHDHARDAAEQAGDRTGQAQARHGLGTVYWQLGRYESAIEYFQQALALFRQSGDRAGEIRALHNLSGVELRMGRYGPAADNLDLALAKAREAGDRLGEARVLTARGVAENWFGRYGSARDFLRQALTLSQSAGDRGLEATALCNLGDAEQGVGHYDSAIEHYGEALALSRELGHQSGEAFSLTGLGTVHTRLGQPEQAAKYHRQALALFRDIGDRDGEAWAHNGLGETALAGDRPAEARDHHTAALTTASDTGAPDQQAHAHLGLGHAYRALGEPAQARRHYRRAVALYTELDSPEAETAGAYLAEDP
jgi:tetratricopeptide (TPR) repeat protein/transcriptional regulator with XRE-family HTH domain